jgi:hypothetical protein
VHDHGETDRVQATTDHPVGRDDALPGQRVGEAGEQDERVGHGHDGDRARLRAGAANPRTGSPPADRQWSRNHRLR